MEECRVKWRQRATNKKSELASCCSYNSFPNEPAKGKFVILERGTFFSQCVHFSLTNIDSLFSSPFAAGSSSVSLATQGQNDKNLKHQR